MPPLPLSEDDIRAVAEYIHSVLATSGRQGGPPGIAAPAPNILTGDATAGQAYFAAKCGSVTHRLAICGDRDEDS